MLMANSMLNLLLGSDTAERYLVNGSRDQDTRSGEKFQNHDETYARHALRMDIDFSADCQGC
jgi:hypothetical protein